MKIYKSHIPQYRLVKEPSDFRKTKLSSSKDVMEYVIEFFMGDITIFESFYMLFLNNANNTTGYRQISQGGITGTIADPRLIAKYAIESLACNVILAHNHPSGSVTPSSADERLTNKIKQGLSLFDINLLDHVIVALKQEVPEEYDYYSFADNGKL